MKKLGPVDPNKVLPFNFKPFNQKTFSGSGNILKYLVMYFYLFRMLSCDLLLSHNNILYANVGVIDTISKEKTRFFYYPDNFYS